MNVATSRAVVRPVEPGQATPCAHCGESIGWSARRKAQTVIANVYVGDRWDRVEHFHASCYAAAGEPYGAAS